VGINEVFLTQADDYALSVMMLIRRCTSGGRYCASGWKALISHVLLVGRTASP